VAAHITARLYLFWSVKLITLTTDFGTRDWFVGTMKGVMLGIQPRAAIVDIAHEIPPGDIRAGAFALAASFAYFPKGTIHVAVVDPGVGGERKAIAVQTANYSFVGPDNGVLSWALAREEIKAIRALENKTYFLSPISRTFHGRDIFAPVAAHLSSGVPISKFGPALQNFARLPWPEPRRTGGRVQGEIIYFDRFGNAVTNIRVHDLPSSARKPTRIRMKGRSLPIGEFYQAVAPGRALALNGSSGLLEISVNGGSAAEILKLTIGDQLTVEPR
jgi:S-adenosylmethionine hydrolase